MRPRFCSHRNLYTCISYLLSSDHTFWAPPNQNFLISAAHIKYIVIHALDIFDGSRSLRRKDERALVWFSLSSQIAKD